MPELEGGCHCGNLRITAHLSGEQEDYAPRACDCDFCHKHGATYVSDPRGSLRIRVAAEGDCRRYRQGSGRAEFLVCARCGVLVAVLHRSGGRVYATVNSRALNVATPFPPELPVSPQRLSATEKMRRWQEIWFADVSVEGLTDCGGDH